MESIARRDKGGNKLLEKGQAFKGGNYRRNRPPYGRKNKEES